LLSDVAATPAYFSAFAKQINNGYWLVQLVSDRQASQNQTE